MKKLLILSVLVLFLAAIGFATLRSSNKEKNATKTEKKDMKKKKECRRTCLFS